MKYTGKFATADQIEAMKACLNRPVMYISCGIPMGDNPQELAHKFAIQAGLPEVTGFYGCDLTTGEFVKAE